MKYHAEEMYQHLHISKESKTDIIFCLSETEIYAMTLAMQNDANRMVEEFQVITQQQLKDKLAHK